MKNPTARGCASAERGRSGHRKPARPSSARVWSQRDVGCARRPGSDQSTGHGADSSSDGRSDGGTQDDLSDFAFGVSGFHKVWSSRSGAYTGALLMKITPAEKRLLVACCTSRAVSCPLARPRGAN